ncbi:MAG: hypothetical protein COU35_03475 [Candidatus Magasanikbacteria bacterium CG10_big_fil_rev_8_21_14_0_10_47_10]|uniref:Uncharacterized protein n=1 Tax=Candidatus Magasanikbacteria bacterium CG10_big_fil_rev_8_21_14_0_10_47_10 TaxID=1974652 RepID=A0A2H0TSF1_9BACT|nr:MAG: hypothetical protein COU35_03475 [Candidatus Magasanikbacteria bacterium CG10_big_fil_rev_8_21_14_0_10_47_10]
MISIPLYTFLLLYFVFLAIFVAFMLVDLYHIITSASFSLVSFIMTFFIFAGTLLVCYFTIQLLSQAGIDWQTPLVLFNASWFSGAFGATTF